MSRRPSGLSIQESTGSKDKHFRVSSADKKRTRQDRKGSGLNHQTVEEGDKNCEIGHKRTGLTDVSSSTQQGVAPMSRPSSSNRRTPTPTKHISLQAIPRKPEYQQESVNSSHQKPVPSTRPTSAPRRTPTPTKQVSLQAIPRKSNNYSSFENNNLKEIVAEQLDDPVLKSSVPQGKTKTSESSKQYQINAKMADSSRRDSSSSTLTCSSNDSLATQSTVSMTTTTESQKVTKDEKERVKNLPTKSTDHVSISDSDEYNTDLDDEETSSEEESDEEPRRAPNELFMEFLACIMGKDYKNAQKLCKMILIYEPNNPEALSFQPLIEHKVQRAEAGEVTSSSDDSDSSSDEDEDDSSDESGDESSDSGEESENGSSSDAEGSAKNSSEDEEDEDGNEEENAEDDGDSDHVTDSGLGSVTDMTQ